MLALVARRHRRTALLLAGLVVVQAVGWTAMWLPRTPGQWLRVSAPAAATLAGVESSYPGLGRSDRLAGGHRPVLRPCRHPGADGPGPGRAGGETWFVIAPTAGIEVAEHRKPDGAHRRNWPALHATLIDAGERRMGVSLASAAGGAQMVVPDGMVPLPAWAPGGCGTCHPDRAGQRLARRLDRGQGYVCDGLEWLKRAGSYEASVTLSASGPVNVEVWNNNGDGCWRGQRPRDGLGSRRSRFR